MEFSKYSKGCDKLISSEIPLHINCKGDKLTFNVRVWKTFLRPDAQYHFCNTICGKGNHFSHCAFTTLMHEIQSCHSEIAAPAYPCVYMYDETCKHDGTLQIAQHIANFELGSIPVICFVILLTQPSGKVVRSKTSIIIRPC